MNENGRFNSKFNLNYYGLVINHYRNEVNQSNVKTRKREMIKNNKVSNLIHNSEYISNISARK